MLSSSSLVYSDGSAACCCASNARICSTDMLATSWSGELEPPPELAEVLPGDEVNENMVHTQISKIFAQLQQRYKGGL